MELLLGGLIGAFLSVIVTVILLPLIQDLLTNFLSTWLSAPCGMKKSSSLAGSSQQDWLVDGRATIFHPESKRELKLFGKSLVGKFTYDGRPYRLRAKIENNTFVSGIWFDQT